MPDWPDDLIVRALHAFGEWAPLEQRLFSSLIRKHDRVWDGGAYLGTFGLGATQIAAEEDRRPDFLLAIEPGRTLAPHLRLNLKQNSPCAWDLAPVGISLDEQMLYPANSSLENFGALAYLSRPEQRADSSDTNSDTGVEGMPLWRLREKFGDYDCLKLDVEGMELNALRSDFTYLKKRAPAIWIECNENPASLKILEALIALDYEPMYLAFPAFRTDNFRNNPKKFFPMAYEASLVGARGDGRDALHSLINRDDVIVAQIRDSWELRKAMWITPRWAEESWTKCSRPELIALLGRMSRNEDISTFPN
ncbi:Methyltransferase, FkbM family OS=Afipia felis OX=1035 GN=BN961_03217 PE=4 SV=1 [Afipia felis]